MHSIKCLILAKELQDWSNLEHLMSDIPGVHIQQRASQLETVLEGSFSDIDLIFCEYAFVEQLTTYSYIYNVKVPPIVCLLSDKDKTEELGANRVFCFLTKSVTTEQVIETIRQAVRNKYSTKEGGSNR